MGHPNCCLIEGGVERRFENRHIKWLASSIYDKTEQNVTLLLFAHGIVWVNWRARIADALSFWLTRRNAFQYRARISCRDASA